ncbi:MAG: FG-GAP repeat domain-containing protein, partial [Chitinophagaceae bacterium]
YRGTAPDSLTLPKGQMLPEDGIPGFEVMEHSFTVNPPTTSLVKITEGKDFRRLWVADLFAEKIYRFDSSLKITDSLQTNKAIVGLDFHENGISFCDIGQINPNNQKLGTAGELIYKNNQLIGIDTLGQLKTLARPVQVTKVDIDLDQQPDYLVNEFGFLTGSLTLYRKNGNEFERMVIKEVAGSTKVYLRDYNGDGLPDIYALFAQGNEGIFLFTNLGGGRFSEKQLLQFPPVYGSTFFEMIDLNGDKKLDIVYTCGDNADFSRVLKPYHGLYIYMNNGDDSYHQTFFYHMNGCYKALARDFDNDGNTDIAAISFFADYTRFPDEGFVYLHNKGNFLFQPYTIKEARGGR